ncbi:proteoglycan 4 [Vigna unguiculata]|uniref:proteoglycan 4 n=1 Tax=Vigna unguiculata TaxID=3917 RepID=UPI001016F098|nr:proteoglycan 4 [Vigna unguiculata]XP_027931195.1 proteoglycan 4 [Vigna unguiculata]XP_027931200.1 proteoglycan 4 [Vigna unguiculata]
MNRSFRAQESQMHSALRRREQQFGGFRTSVMKDKEEELALFLEMKRREKERSDLLLNGSEDFDAPLGSNASSNPIFNISSSTPAPVRKTGVDDFLNSENDKNDYDWLLTPPGTPLFPSLEMESRKTVMSQLGTPTTRPVALKSRLANHQSEPAGRTNFVSKQPASSPGLSSSSGGTRRPSSSGGPGSRPATPTGRPTLTASSKSSRPSTPTRSTIPSNRSMAAASKNTVSTTKPSVSTTKPLSSAAKTPVPAAKSSIPSRSSTPMSRSAARSSTPTSRPTLPPSRSTSRASTPTRRPSLPSNEPIISASSVKASLSPKPTTVTSRQPTPVTTRKPAPVNSRQPAVPSRGSSPTVRSRPWKPSDMPGFSLDAPPNLRTTLPDRPLSATRGRPGAPTSRSSSVEPSSSGRPRRQSCSPSRGRASNGVVHISGNSMPAVSRGRSKVNDNVSPVVMGNKMVERVINMRKLAPPMIDDKNSPRSNLSGKSTSSPDSSGFGRTLSKKSLDMAIRHMDIRRTIPGNLRPLMTNIPASSLYSVRSGSHHGRTISVSGSPHATSSNASSELSVNQNGICLDSSEVDDDIGSERCGQSPASVRGR